MAKRPRKGFSLDISVTSVEHKCAWLSPDLLRLGEQALLVCQMMRSDAAAVMSGNGRMMGENTEMRQRLGNRKRLRTASLAHASNEPVRER
jgi:hypothetical protein